jgi:chemotaxis protein MotB
MTFADLMSLLMCFFVLLLSFSEMDVSKYKEMAGSLKDAFGVQRDIRVKEPPKGINVIAREFSPGRPEPTHLNIIRQMTTNDLRINLDLGKERRRPVPTPKAEHEPDKEKSFKPEESAKNRADREEAQKAGQKADDKAGANSGKRAHLMPGKQRSQADGLSAAQRRELAKAKVLAARRLEEKLKAEALLDDLQKVRKKDKVNIDRKALDKLLEARQAALRQKRLSESAKLISAALGREIKAGSVDVETAGQKIIIRVREKASFGSGHAELKDGFRPLLARVAKILKGSEGKIIVAGHTDNVPIYTERFRSNWELSAARAVSVAHAMMEEAGIASGRFLIQGFADTEPVASNNTAANRAKNRRVEIILQQGEDKSAAQQISAGQGSAASLPAVPGTGQTGAQAPAGTPAAAVKVGGGSGVAAGSLRKDAADKQVSPVKSESSLGIRAVGR